MIVTDLENVAEQITLSPALRQAFDFLRHIPGQNVADGKVEIDGNHVYAVVQSYQAQSSGEWLFEGHREYVDIQYIVAGEEIIGWASTKQVTVTVPYDKAKDTWMGTMPPHAITPVRLGAGQLAVLYPSDAHAPKRAADGPAWVKKIVVKVALTKEA